MINNSGRFREVGSVKPGGFSQTSRDLTSILIEVCGAAGRFREVFSISYTRTRMRARTHARAKVESENLPEPPGTSRYPLSLNALEVREVGQNLPATPRNTSATSRRRSLACPFIPYSTVPVFPNQGDQQ